MDALMAERIKPERKELFKELAEQRERFNQTHPVQKTQWYVGEHTDDYEDDYGSYRPGTNYGKVSPYFDSEEEMNQWMTEYKPTHGKFYTRKRFLRLVPEHTEWYDY
jgi:hypothetical protein